MALLWHSSYLLRVNDTIPVWTVDWERAEWPNETPLVSKWTVNSIYECKVIMHGSVYRKENRGKSFCLKDVQCSNFSWPYHSYSDNWIWIMHILVQIYFKPKYLWHMPFCKSFSNMLCISFWIFLLKESNFPENVTFYPWHYRFWLTTPTSSRSSSEAQSPWHPGAMLDVVMLVRDVINGDWCLGLFLPWWTENKTAAELCFC